MIRKTLIAAAVAALLAGSLQASAHPHSGRGYGPAAAGAPQLFTPEERTQFRERMRNATSAEERAQLRQEMHGLAEQRAKEKGITLPQHRENWSAQRGARHGIASLFSPEERTQLRDKLRNAQTPEQRAEVRKEIRSLAEQRAKEKGIELREHRRMHRGPRGFGGPTPQA